MGKIIRRILTIIPAVALQSLWLLLLMKWLTPYAPIIVSLLSVAAFFLVVFIIIKRDETAYKLLWLLVILSLPLVGALLYLLFGNKRTARPLKRRLQQVQKSCNPQPLPIKEAPFDGEKRMGQTVRWLEEKTQYPMCAVEQVRYYPLGDNMFPDMLADLKNARNSIYEYTPGFVHAKSFVSDDKVATIGTVNLDYRSLFLHFENNSFFYRSSIIAAIKDDFIATQAKCKEVKPYDMKHYSRRWVVDGVLRIFAPLC